MTIEVFLVWVESIFFVISILVLLAMCVAGLILFQRISQINNSLNCLMDRTKRLLELASQVSKPLITVAAYAEAMRIGINAIRDILARVKTANEEGRRRNERNGQKRREHGGWDSARRGYRCPGRSRDRIPLRSA